ncbi:hypothetical protein HRbin14_02196 [bacterium HR14]|nr:hypothetical protein HRbin14_02196 [bacterium HR14]
MLFHPLGKPEWARIDAGFLDPAYLRQIGAEHPGVDLNRAGTSGDMDLGHPIAALAPGVVEEVAQDDVWGHVVLIRHDEAVARMVSRLLGLEIGALWSQYAHLIWPVVVRGQRVLGGQAVGGMGKGGRARYWAHLHFELRTKPLPALYWPGKRRGVIEEAYIDPVPILAACRQEHRYLWDRLIVNLTRPDAPMVRTPREGEV